MGKDSKIAWCDHSWNCWRGCHKTGLPECENCYMYRDQKRYGRNPSVVVRSKTTFEDPLKWKDPARVFVCSWSDFWIKEADPWRREALDVMARAPWHTYIIPTKRPQRALEKIKEYEGEQHDNWQNLFPNVWGLVSAGTQKTADDFVPKLLETPFAVRGVSAEPLLELVDFMPYYGPVKGWVKLSWLILGVESAAGKRVGRLGAFESERDWIAAAADMVATAKYYGIPVFVKQIPIGGRVNDDPTNWPEELRVQEFPR